MLVFVNNIPVYILEKNSDLSPTVNLKQNKIGFEMLEGNPVIENASEIEIISLFHFLQTNATHKTESVTFLVKKESAFKKYLKSNLNFVKAAGGVVENHDHKILLMKRLGFWDLPKGKAEKKEKSDKTAIREVEEECGVTVFIYKKIATTWHTYFNKGDLTIKRTKWYSMGLISDLKMKPQTEEGIEELKWMTEEEVEKAILNSYESIRFVLKSWHKEKILK